MHSQESVLQGISQQATYYISKIKNKINTLMYCWYVRTSHLEMFCEKLSSYNFYKIHKKSPALESLVQVGDL